LKRIKKVTITLFPSCIDKYLPSTQHCEYGTCKTNESSDLWIPDAYSDMDAVEEEFPIEESATYEIPFEELEEEEIIEEKDFNEIEMQIPLSGLIAYYPFSGNANDESGNGRNGTVIGASLRIGCLSPNDQQFEGSIDEVMIYDHDLSDEEIRTIFLLQQ
jgi:hypothetical protein